MQIAQVLANYTLGGADLLRRAMGKKKPEEMAKQRAIFLEGALGREVAEATATYIFDLMEKFAGYGFNKSHSAAYALLAYQTAWLKAHHPAPFMAAVLSADMDNTDKVVGLIEECRSMGLEVTPPDINRSEYRFAVANQRTVVYGLGAIKGVGEAALEGVLKARAEGTPFKTLVDLCQRVDLSKLNKRVLETLIRAGAMDTLGETRATLLAQLPIAMAAAEQVKRSHQLGVVDLFGAPEVAELPTLAAQPEMAEEERLRGEKETLGLYLTGHPVAAYRDELRRLTGSTLQALASRLEAPAETGMRRPRQESARIAGLIVGVRVKTRQGGRMAFVTLDDQTGRADIILFNEQYQEYQSLLELDTLLVAEGNVSRDEYNGGVRMRAQRLLGLDAARAEWAKVLDVSLQDVAPEHIHALHQVLREHTPEFSGPAARCRLRMRYCDARATVELKLPEHWAVQPSEPLLRTLGQILGSTSQIGVFY